MAWNQDHFGHQSRHWEGKNQQLTGDVWCAQPSHRYFCAVAKIGGRNFLKIEPPLNQIWSRQKSDYGAWEYISLV